jgi:two-component system response regulator NreC
MSMPYLRLLPDLSDSAPAGAGPGIRVLLADDHELMRRTLRALLDAEADLAVVAEADDPASLVRGVDSARPHVLVLDLSLPREPSSQAIRQLREQLPGMQVVIVSMQESSVFAERAHAAGAIGFVLKDRADEELAKAIRRAAREERYLSPRLELPRRTGVRPMPGAGPV